MFGRNWGAICHSDEPLRTVISSATHDQVLEAFSKAHPDLFKKGKDEGPLYVRLSTLKKASREYAETQHDDPGRHVEDSNFTLNYACQMGRDELSIPTAFYWEGEPKHEDYPQGLVDQLIGQKAQAGMVVTHHGRKHMVMNIEFYDKVTVGETFKKAPAVRFLVLVDAEFVDLKN